VLIERRRISVSRMRFSRTNSCNIDVDLMMEKMVDNVDFTLIIKTVNFSESLLVA
jgi:hypothetical protein